MGENMGLDTLICSIIKTRRVLNLIKSVKVTGNEVEIVIEIPKEYSKVLECLRELEEGVNYA